MLRFEWFRRWLGGRWYLCEFPGYDCGGIYIWRRCPHKSEVVIERVDYGAL